MIINKVYTAADVFEIANTGAANLKFAFCPDEVTPTGGGIGLAPGETKTVTASELGDFATNHYLNCTNGDAVEGSFKIKLP
jgi:hypothetical protein